MTMTVRALASQMLLIMLPVGTTLAVVGAWLGLQGHLDAVGEFELFVLAAVFVTAGLCGVALDRGRSTDRHRPPAKRRGR